MDRKESIKTILLGSFSIPFLAEANESSPKESTLALAGNQRQHKKAIYESPWKRLPDMTWTGAAYWANRLQDWRIKDGKLECVVRGENRSVFCLTHELENSRNSFSTSVQLRFAGDIKKTENNRAGIRLGADGDFDDYRSAAIYGEGLDAGVDSEGRLFIGNETRSSDKLSTRQLNQGILLKAVARPRGLQYALRIMAYDFSGKELLLTTENLHLNKDKLTGSIGLFSDINDFAGKKRNTLSVRFANWILEGKKFEVNPDHTYGPIYFAQYTQYDRYLQLTAQLAPVPLPASAFLEIKENGAWQRKAEAEVEYPSYTARFKITDWDNDKAVPYRVVFDLPLQDGSTHQYTWNGTIAAEPYDKEKIKALVCSCNFDYGFPDQEVVDNASKHNPDLAMFVGDQFYEPSGGFGVQRAPEGKAYLDYLRKWYQFGWSYRDLFRDIPSICLPDDHDVYQGNIFGSGGDKVPDKPGSFDRDWGGYVMPADWVNLVMTTQTSHMPDPYNPEPIKQGIHVFYTDWKYAGISFGIVEDRKFKSGPKEILPDSVEERDGFITSPDYDISEHEFPDAELLGDRQIEFLKQWVKDWSRGTEFKALVSATTFHSLQTLPNGAESNGEQRNLRIPRPDEYIKGDELVADMDSNGWPQNRRDEILNIIRKGFVIHLNGDQHLASITKYGINNYGDAGYQFTVPALNNSWPRRWWPPLPKDHQPVPGQPPYTGDFRDGFDNPMHVMAVANPQKTGLKPDYIYDRAPGYGIVTLDKESREITMECWPRHIDPELEPGKQYKGWPWTVEQLNNYTPSDGRFLPTFKIKGSENPVVRVIHEKTGTLDHILRKGEGAYQPMVKAEGTYTVEIVDDQQQKSKNITGLNAKTENKKEVTVNL